MRLQFDSESGALYIGIREVEIEEKVDLADPGFGTYVEVDREGRVLGVEFLSLKEFTELVTYSGDVLELSDKTEDLAGLSPT